MGYFPFLGSLLAVDLLAAMSPGPNFVLVTQTAIRRTPRHAAAVVCGLFTSNLIWCCAVTLGLSALFDVAPWLYRGMRIGGGAYLLYLGASLWRSDSDAGQPVEAPFQSSLRAAFLRGLLTNLANPKSVVYFSSIFTLFLRPGTPAWVQTAAVGIVMIDTGLWYGGVAALFSRVRAQRLYATVQRPVNRVAGAVMILFCVRLMLVRE
jgi:threonine efflux protein